jgi:hypothetical protein
MPSSGLTLQQRVQKRLVRDSSGCWLWTGSCTHNGYGTVGVKREDGSWSRAYVHRLTFLWANGPIPPKLDLDHLCRVRHCANPNHLEPVTRGENTRRGLLPSMIRARFLRDVKACKNGHAFDAENTIWRKTGGRACRKCAQLRSIKYEVKRSATRTANRTQHRGD